MQMNTQEKDINLQACLDDFLFTDNHKMFKEYYNRENISKKEKFAERLNAYIYKNKSTDRKDCKLTKSKLFLLRDHVWHDYTYTIKDVEKTWENFISKKDKESTNSNKEQKKEKIYESTIFSKWTNSTTKDMPGKEALIQLGIVLKLSVEQVNELLYLSDNQVLYTPSLSDYVAIFYLMKFSKEEREENIDMEKAYERIVEVKNKYNDTARKVRDKKLHFVVDEKHDSNILFFDKLNVKQSDMDNLTEVRKRNEKHRWDDIYNIVTNIINSVAMHSNDCENEEQYFSEENLYNLFRCHWGFNKRTQDYLKNYNNYKYKYFYTRTFLPVKSCDKKILIEERKIESAPERIFDILQKDGLEEKDFSSLRHYKRLLAGILNKEDWEAKEYEQDPGNIDNRGINYIDLLLYGQDRLYDKKGLIVQTKNQKSIKSIMDDFNNIVDFAPKDIFFIEKKDCKLIIHKKREGDIEIFKDEKDKKEKNKEEKVKKKFGPFLYKIDERYYVNMSKVKEFKPDKLILTNGKEFDLTVNKIKELKKVYARKKDAFESERFYKESSSKRAAQKLAILTGNEDDLQEYMLLGGFWAKKVYYCGNVSKTEDGFKLLHEEDKIIVYALLCKDILISEWTKQYNLGAVEKIKLIKEFPFLELYYQIKREIFSSEFPVVKTEENNKYQYIFEL